MIMVKNNVTFDDFRGADENSVTFDSKYKLFLVAPSRKAGTGH
jgi:hypothetical protein